MPARRAPNGSSARHPLRILMVSRGVVPIARGCGGAELVCFQLARTLASEGHHVTLVADVDPDMASAARAGTGLSVVPIDSRLRTGLLRLPGGFLRWLLQHLVGNVTAARVAYRLLRSDPGAYDLIHCHGSLSAVLISFFRTAPLVYTEHDATPWSCRYRHRWERAIRKLVYRGLNVAAFRRVDRVITGYEALAQEIVERWGIPPARVVPVSNGTDLDLFSPARSESPVARELGFDRYALFVGSLVPRKCPDLLLRAIAEVEGLSAIIVGDGPMRRKLERLAENLGLADRVAFLGSLSPESLGAIYAEADMLVLPSVSEACPLVSIEAMACGTPVLATGLPGLRSIVKDWETGFLVKPGDIGQLVMGMRFLAGDSELRARMGENGRMKVIKEFVWPVVAARYLELYRRLLVAVDAPDRPGGEGPIQIVLGEGDHAEASLSAGGGA